MLNVSVPSIKRAREVIDNGAGQLAGLFHGVGMAIADWVTAAGIGAQIGAAGYLVWGARNTARKLKAFPVDPTYGSFSGNLSAVTVELAEQYRPQRTGFVWLAIGSAAQLAGLYLQVK